MKKNDNLLSALWLLSLGMMLVFVGVVSADFDGADDNLSLPLPEIPSKVVSNATDDGVVEEKPFVRGGSRQRLYVEQLGDHKWKYGITRGYITSFKHGNVLFSFGDMIRGEALAEYRGVTYSLFFGGSYVLLEVSQ